jgi:dTDP-4-dehydrorhamnose reductase
MTARALIFGAGGQLGSALRETTPQDAIVTAVDLVDADVRDGDAVERLFQATRPNVVFNCAAYTNVDGAEAASDEATATNGVAPGVIAIASKRVGAKLLHVSTDYVFDGTSSHPYSTAAVARPVNVYGATKLEGERRVLAADTRSVVIRTAWLHSGAGSNFVKTAVDILGSGTSMRAVDDQIGTPTRAAHLAVAMWRVAERPEICGLLHFTDAGVASWYDVAAAVRDALADAGRLPRGTTVEPIDSSQRASAAARPAYSVLDKHDCWRLIGYTPPHWRDGVVASVRELTDA